VSKIVKLLEVENRMEVARGWTEREMGSYSMGIKLQFHKNEQILEIFCRTQCLQLTI
jgi:hypothetical protein